MTSSRRSTPARTQRRIYMPVLHGIGTTDHNKFAARSVERIAEHLDDADAWNTVPCSSRREGFAPKHRHLIHTSGTETIIDPISWFQLIESPRRWRSACWLVRTLLTLCCVHFLVNGHAMMNLGTGLPGLRESLSHPLRSAWVMAARIGIVLRGMMWIVLLSGATLIALALGVPLIFLIPSFHKLVADALGWTSDQATREAVV